MANLLAIPERTNDMEQSILAIDPGPTESGVILFNPRNNKILFRAIAENKALKKDVSFLGKDDEAPLLAIEMIACYGMPVGKETFETCLWIGRFEEAFDPTKESLRCYRKDIKLHLCGTAKAKDPNVRQALIDRLGEPGSKKNQGPTFGVTSHMWSALAVAVYAADKVNAAGVVE